MKRLTADRASTITTADPPTGIHAPERIGKRRSRTPEGFLLCEDVPIARTGWMVYGPGETAVKTSDSGVSMIHRGPDALFHPVTVSSFNGKAVTDDHPAGGDIHTGNWKEHARGTVHNVRRGTDEDADTLRADLLITDEETIKKVEAGKVEVSAGYDANYETTGPGEGRQHNIIGNHVALVDKGRCGPRCAIGDSQPITATQPRRKLTMPGKARRTVTEAVRKLFTDASEAAVGLLEEPPLMGGNDEEEDADDGKGTHVHVHMHGGAGSGPVGAGQTGGADDAASAGEAAAVGGGEGSATADPTEARFVAIEGTLAKILAKMGGDAEEESPAAGDGATADSDNPFVKKGEKTEDADMTEDSSKTADSAALATSFQTLVSDCEVLVPGFKTPTFDAKVQRKVTVDSMCATRRKALDAFNVTTEGSTLLAQVAGGKTIDVAGMPCASAALLFNAAVTVRKAANNNRTTDGAGRLPILGDGTTRKSTTLSIHEINELNRKKYPV